ncbi:hypothetical protein CPB83DRAFT_836997 [Crepidotus variabilis]|uniref:Uncharacterized protein n=1 Tax=Crepidotus variabilis TaxID=179855 RepID=A0A9P6ECC7_9AGAR|nr:hypothetical protein CPB83DRAFT_836997 [Crepidotus variabilis]
MSIAVFFTSDIPEKTVDRFLDAVQANTDDAPGGWGSSKTEDKISLTIAIVNSKDYSQYPTRTTRQFKPFHSPFTGELPEQVASWFRGATDPRDVKRPFPGVLAFIILDEQTVKDNQSCLLHFAFDYAGYFMRSRLVLTKKNQRLAERWSFLPIVNETFTDNGNNRYGEFGDEYIQEY